MTEQFEREVRRAFETFIAEIKRAAQRAAIEGIRSALTPESSQAGAAVVTAADDRPSSETAAFRRKPTKTGLGSRERVITFIAEHPGWGTVQLAQALGCRTDRLRRYLRVLADDGAIRIEEISTSGQRRRTYFVVEHVNGTGSEPSGTPAEATK